MRIGTVDIEVHAKTEAYVQGRYLVHGDDDILWTDDLDAALAFVRDSVEMFTEGAIAEEE